MPSMHGKAHEIRKGLLRNLKSFGGASDSMRAAVYPSGIPGTQISKGRMPQEDRDDLNRSIVVYVVYSYATPIAWVTDSGVVVNPQTSYSPTTSRHQTHCRVHLAMSKQRVEGQV